MELSNQTLSGLVLFSKENFDDAAFKAVVGAAFKAATGESKHADEEKLLKGASNALRTKQAYASLLTVILEGAKHNAPASEITGGLEESKWSDDRVRHFVSQYDHHKSGIRAALATQSAFPFPAVTGISWRMDYYMRSNLLEKVKVPVYFVTLHTQTNDGKSADVQLTLSLEEMNDLLAKCRDMAKAVERALVVTAKS